MDIPMMKQLINGHPAIMNFISLIIGTYGGIKIQTCGVDWLVQKSLAWQKERFLRAGATPEEVKEFEKHEAAVLLRASQDISQDADSPVKP